jgi:hypothetical protein
MKLSVDNVTKVFEDCLAHGSDSHPTITAVGIMSRAHFEQAKLADHHADIGDMLAQLPLPFQPLARGGASGWSFLNACNDRDEQLWTGSHPTMEQLVMLGLATGQAAWCIEDRAMWPVLPGGMPYVMVVEHGPVTPGETP